MKILSSKDYFNPFAKTAIHIINILYFSNNIFLAKYNAYECLEDMNNNYYVYLILLIITGSDLPPMLPSCIFISPSCNTEKFSLLNIFSFLSYFSILEDLDRPGILLTSTDDSLANKRFSFASSDKLRNEARSGPIPVSQN